MFTVTWFEVLGVALATLAAVLIGGLWYSPFLFGQLWMREVGLTEEKMRNASATPAQVIVTAVVLDALFAAFLNVLFTWIGVRTVAQGSLFAVACCVTFFCIPMFVHGVFEDRSRKAWAVYASHEILFAAVAGAIVSWSILA